MLTIEGLYILGKNSALGAIYNSLERQKLDTPKCHPNTRKAVMKKLFDWIYSPIEADILIMWLYGAAGAGKSAIAHTLAEICESCGLLLASFFFWKTAGERDNANRFVATIAHQVTLAIPASRALIMEAVNYNPFIFEQSIDVQLRKLIIEPLMQLISASPLFDISPFVIIIDGLDECQGSDVQSGLVKSLVAAFRHLPLHIRILIASRPEVHLQSTFNSTSVQSRLSRLPLSHEYSAEKDIYRFLEDSFTKMRHEHPLASYIPSSWPGPTILRELTRKSSGQFIFASTTVKYTGGDPYELPTRRLDVIRQLQPPRGEEDLPYAELNSLYTYVLSNVRNIERVKQVLGVLLIANPILDPGCKFRRPGDIDDLFFWQPGETQACLGQLASVIECSEASRISIIHASLSDFLLDPSRSHGFSLCRESVLGDTAAFGLRHLRQDITGVSFPTFRKGPLTNSMSSAPTNSTISVDPEDYKPWYIVNTNKCFEALPYFTLALRQELSVLSPQGLYEADGPRRRWSSDFWEFFANLFQMLCDQVRFYSQHAI